MSVAERVYLTPLPNVIKPKTIFRWHIIGGLCLMRGYRKGAELGVSKGRFTMFLSATMHDMSMTAIDRWAPQPDNLQEDGETYSTWDHETSYSEFKRNCAEYFPGRVKIIRGDSAETAAQFEDGSFDFAFIDADHSYTGCKRDIDAWHPKVRQGGMVCGHDYSQERWPGVVKAVEERYGADKMVFPDMVWVHFKG